MAKVFEKMGRSEFEGVCDSLGNVVAFVLALGGKVVIDNEGENPCIEINYLGRKVKMSPTKGVDDSDIALHEKFTAGMSPEETGYEGLCSIAALRCYMFHESQLRGNN